MHKMMPEIVTRKEHEIGFGDIEKTLYICPRIEGQIGNKIRLCIFSDGIFISARRKKSKVNMNAGRFFFDRLDHGLRLFQLTEGCDMDQYPFSKRIYFFII